MNDKTATERSGSQQQTTGNVAPPLDATVGRGPYSAESEPARRLDADMQQALDSSPFEPGVEAEPSANPPQPSAPVEVCQLLNQCLVNCIDVRLQCKQAQWELSAADVDALVLLCAQTAASIEQYADRLAARITALGGVADGTLDTVAEHSGLDMYPFPVAHDRQHVDAVASALAVTVVSLRSEFAVLAGGCDTQTRELLQELAAGLESHRAALHAQPSP